MKTSYDLNLDLNLISNRNGFKSIVSVGDVATALIDLSSEFSYSKIEVVISERDFSLSGSTLTNALKSANAKTALLIIEESDFHYTSLEKSFSLDVDAVIAVGEESLLSAVRYYSSMHGVICYAVPTTPCIENILSSTVSLKTKDLPEIVKAEAFKKVFIDQNIILKADLSYFAESYISVMSKLTALIDYKINCFLSGTSVDGEVFSLTKHAVNTLAKLTSYENYKMAILGAELILSSLDTEVFDGSGVEVVKNCLSIFTSGVSNSQKILTAFEKTAKIYHMYFSNDFSDLLSLPDYESDFEVLESQTGLERGYFYKNLKIPSERRRKLINLLMQKTRQDFKRETAIILAVLPSVIKIYKKLNNKERKNLSYKQIKNAVCLGAYLTDKTSTLTLCRDEGILKCAN